jgi:hypothetical protein
LSTPDDEQPFDEQPLDEQPFGALAESDHIELPDSPPPVPEAPVSPAVFVPSDATNGHGAELIEADGDQGEREPVSVGAGPLQSDEGQTWNSPADRGWRAAQAASEPAASSTTKTGLPKRVPMAHFVPGRVESSATPRSERTGPKRSPEAVRGVLSSYRSGLEQGRQVGTPRSGTAFAGSREEQEEM